MPTVLSSIHGGISRRETRCLIDRAHGRVSDRKSTRLNSSHVSISYAVFCLKKKKKKDKRKKEKRKKHTKERKVEELMKRPGRIQLPKKINNDSEKKSIS